MKLRSLQLEQFKKFDQAVRIDGFSDGLNLIAGPNEMGKSTLLLALRAALFERHAAKSQAIKALQPNHIQGGAPSVMVEFDMADGLHRIEKRFLRRPMARLTRPDGQLIEGNEAEAALQKILRLGRDESLSLDKGSPGHFGVMLIPQSQSFYQPSLAQSTRHTLEEAVTAEIEQLGNQSEVDAVLANVEAAIFEIVDKRSKPKGRYRDVEGQLAEIGAEIRTLQDDRDELIEDIEALTKAEEQLRSLQSLDAEDDLQARLEDLEGQRAELVQRKEIEAHIAAARYSVERLIMTRDQQQKREVERTSLVAEQSRLGEEERREREQLAEREAELSEQQTKRQSLIEREGAIQEKRRYFEQLNTQLMQRSEIENALRAIATEVTIDLESEALDRVQLDGQPVDRAGEVIHVIDGLTIDIQDIGRITVLPKVDDLERLRDRRDTLDRSITSLLKTLGLERAEPEPIEILWQENEEEAARLAANRTELEGILNELLKIVEDKRPIVLTLAAKRQQVEERLMMLADELVAGDPADDQTSDELAQAIAKAEATLAEATKAEKALPPLSQPAPAAPLEDDIKSLKLRLDERARNINETKVTIGRLGAKVSMRAGRGLDERLDECCRRRDILSREQSRFQLDAQALSLLKTTLTAAADDAKTHFHAPLAARLTPYIQSLLPETETEVTADFGIAALHRGKPTSETFEQLSDGTREQIAILARLAFATMLKEQGLPALVVLDDALVFSDEQRLTRMFDILETAAKTLQIVILTCREDRFLDLKAKPLELKAPPAPGDLAAAVSA